tara:strand:+ start:2239 stop:2808 length:570 start_codon:yes stop_codon:yes gene_type:complete
MLRSKGFSIIELMVVMLILAVLLGVGAPAFLETVRNNRMITEVYALRASLANARSEALARRRTVTVCESTDSLACAADPNAWSEGYLAFVDADGDGVADPNEIILTRVVTTPDLSITFTAGPGTLGGPGFRPRGDSLGFSGTFTFCDPRGATSAAGLILRNPGDARAAEDDDTPEDNIVNDLEGNNVSC